MLKKLISDAIGARNAENLKTEIISDIMRAGSWLLFFAIVVFLSFRARFPFFITGSLWLAIILVVVSVPFIIRSKLRKYRSGIADGTIDVELARQRAAGMFFYSVALSTVLSLMLSLLSILQQSTGVLDIPIIIISVWLLSMFVINVFWFLRWINAN